MTLTGLAAVLVAAAAAAWGLGPHPNATRLRAVGPGRPGGRRRARTIPRWVQPAGGLVGVVAFVGTLGGGRVVWPGVALAVAGIAAASLRRSAARHREVAARRRRLAEACDVLAAELRAGRAPAMALARAANSSPELAPAARTAALGGDVMHSLGQVAALPGGEAGRAIAAGWSVAERSGAGLATVLTRLASGLRADENIASEVSNALAVPRATGRLLCALPVFGLFLGGTLGASPVTFLLTTTAGNACLVGGTVLAALGLWWVEQLANRAEVG